MKANTTYLRGKSVFVVSLIVVGVTILTVYLTGINYNRTVTSNLYLSLSIIGLFLFTFMVYGLYQGIGLVDNFPKYKDLTSRDLLSTTGDYTSMPSLDLSEGPGGVLVSIILWIVMTIIFLVLLLVLEAMLWLSLFVILAMLYWVFFRALRLVFSKTEETKGDIAKSLAYSLGYTCLFTGWIFGIAYLVDALQ